MDSSYDSDRSPHGLDPIDSSSSSYANKFMNKPSENGSIDSRKANATPSNYLPSKAKRSK